MRSSFNKQYFRYHSPALHTNWENGPISPVTFRPVSMYQAPLHFLTFRK